MEEMCIDSYLRAQYTEKYRGETRNENVEGVLLSAAEIDIQIQFPRLLLLVLMAILLSRTRNLSNSKMRRRRRLSSRKAHCTTVGTKPDLIDKRQQLSEN